MTSSSPPSAIDCRPRSAGWNVSTPKSRLRLRISVAISRDRTRRTSTSAWGCALAKRSRKGSSVCTAASLAPTMTRPRRTCCSSRTATSASAASVSSRPGVLLEQAPRFGQGAVADGPIEQAIAELFLEPADGLAHGGLGAMQLLGGDRKAAFRRNRDKCAQILQLHRSNYNLALFKSNKYKLDSRLEPGLQRYWVPPTMTTTNRLTIFDTTLRDGEQAPGFSLRIDEKLKMAQQLSALGVDVIEAGFPITSEADAEAVRLVSTECAGAGHRRARALSSGRHRSRRLGPLAGAPPPHPHVHRHLRPAPGAQAPHVEGDLSRRRRRRRQAGEAVHRRRPVLGRGCDAQRPRLPVPGRRSRHRGRVHDGQPARHRGVRRSARNQRPSSRRF